VVVRYFFKFYFSVKFDSHNRAIQVMVLCVITIWFKAVFIFIAQKQYNISCFGE